MNRGEGGDDVVLRCAYVSLSKVCSVVVWGYVLYRARGGAVAEEGADFLGRFVVRDEVSDVVVTGLEKIEHTFERFGVRVSRLVWHRF